MVRKIIVPENTTISFNIPKDYVGKELEIIVFSKNEGMPEAKKGNKNSTFNALSIDTKGYSFNRDEANER